MKAVRLVGFVLLSAVTGGQAQDPRRSALPDPASVKKAEALVREVLKEEYSRKAPADRLAAARRLIEQGRETRDDPPARFVLLRDARDIAVELGECAVAWSASQEVVSFFEVERLAYLFELLEALDKTAKAPDQLRLLSGYYLDLFDQAQMRSELRLAEKAGKGASAASRRGKDLAGVQRAEAKLQVLAEVQIRSDKLIGARETLARNPADPAANRLVGEDLAFAKGDWEAALPHLARCDDAGLRSLASMDLKKPTDADEQAAVGDAWWDEAGRRATARRPLQDRAIAWYKLAWPKLTGLVREKARSRCRIFQLNLAATNPPPTAAPAGWGFQDYWMDLDGAFVKDGRVSARMIPSKGESGWSSLTTVKVPASGGQEYEISAWVISENTVGGDGLYLRFHDADGKFIQQSGPAVPIDVPFWSLISRKVRAPVTAVQMDVSLQMSSKQGTIWLDDVRLHILGAKENLLQNGSFEQLGK
jgi:hypothetical protein